MDNAPSFLSHVRGVELLPGEHVAAFLDAEHGLSSEPTPTGRLLVATNRRIISVTEEGHTRVVQMFAADTVTAVSVRNDARRGLSWKQWATLLAGGRCSVFPAGLLAGRPTARRGHTGHQPARHGGRVDGPDRPVGLDHLAQPDRFRRQHAPHRRTQLERRNALHRRQRRPHCLRRRCSPVAFSSRSRSGTTRSPWGQRRRTLADTESRRHAERQ